MATKTEKVPGHKRSRVLYGVTVVCECGFTAGPWYGKGASTNAHNEWRWHLDQCRTPQRPAPEAPQ